MTKKNTWVLGASTGLGRQIAEELAANGHDLVLSSRNERDLIALTSHIRIKYSTRAEYVVIDLEKIGNEEDAKSIVKEISSGFGLPDTCYFLAGNVFDEDESTEAVKVIDKIFKVNFTGIIFLINEMIIAKNKSDLNIVVASSIAAIRPRGKNIAYSTAKKALEHYCLGLLHALADTSVKIQIVRFGYMDTNMAFGKKLLFKPASTSYISKKLIAMLNSRSGIFYIPWFWYFIGVVINLLPFTIYKKMKF